ncbi:MAG: hypothetical protein AVDCRST_MAG11-785, partial [uncultured Gemmatimonadaceae bacterium]
WGTHRPPGPPSSHAPRTAHHATRGRPRPIDAAPRECGRRPLVACRAVR